MESMRSTSRLDDFAKHTDQRFDAIDRRFDKVDGELREIRTEIGSLHRTIIQFAAVLVAAQIGMMATILATQL